MDLTNKALAYLESILQRKYGNLENDSGCIIYNTETGEHEWLSVKQIVELLHRADEEFEG